MRMQASNPKPDLTTQPLFKTRYRITESLPVTLIKAVCCICCFQVQASTASEIVRAKQRVQRNALLLER